MKTASNQLLDRLFEEKKINRRYKGFFIRNQISSYYYCGSVAHSAIVAYNPYFEDIEFDKTTKDISFHSSNVYSPGFLLNILIGLKVIENAEDISSLSKDDINVIRSDKAWTEFKKVFDQLNRNTQSLDLILQNERNSAKKLEMIKRFAFFFATGAISTALSVAVDQIAAGFVMLGVSTIVNFCTNIVYDSRLLRKAKRATSDEIINRVYATKEPFYVISQRIKAAMENTLK